MRTLVTGAGGFVGRHLVTCLLNHGQTVRVATTAPSNTFDARVEYFRASELGSEQTWRAVVKGVDTVIHLAGRAHVLKETVADPLAAFRAVNVDMTVALANAAAGAGVRRLVFASSIGVNGTRTIREPFTERSPVSPSEFYAMSKWEAEERLRRLRSELEVTIVRIPLVYGPGVKGNFLRLLWLASSGFPLPLSSVSNRRSYLGVRNLCDVLARCSEEPSAAGELFLVADGSDISTPSLVSILAKEMGRSSRLIACPTPVLRRLAAIVGKTPEVERLTCSLQVDASYVRQRLHWTPPVSVEAGLAEMARWYSGVT